MVVLGVVFSLLIVVNPYEGWYMDQGGGPHIQLNEIIFKVFSHYLAQVRFNDRCVVRWPSSLP